MAQSNTTTTTTTIAANGGTIIVTTQSNTYTVGNFVTDVNIQPYIANRIISFFAYNMRPNQRMHFFFDSVLVDAYCAPAIIPTLITNTADHTTILKNGNWGDAVYSDSAGHVAGQFNIPAGKFKIGDRIFQITDVTSIVQGNNAFTTTAAATFTASNLSVTKESITLTTVNKDTVYIPPIPIIPPIVTDPGPAPSSFYPDSPSYDGGGGGGDPIAQTLTINTAKDLVAGLYVTSLDLYFKQKSQINQNGVTVYLCEMDNGYPSKHILPFSLTHLNYANVNISNTANVATTFTFESPVYLNNNTEYAFVVKPDANDPDYFLYTANLGDIDLTTGHQVYSQPVVGTAFYGATSGEWTALQSEYIKFNLRRAVFTNNSGDAYFNNSNTDILTIYNLGYNNTSVGILPGDYVYQATNSTPSTANTSVYGIFNYYDTPTGYVYVDYSTGNFSSNSFIQIHRFANATAITPNTTTIIAYANTSSLHNPVVDALVPQFAMVSPPGTSIVLDYKGTSNAYSIDSTATKITPGYESEFYDQQRIIASVTNENTSMSSSKSMTIHAKLVSDTNYLSPIIDTVRNQQLLISNQIDPVSFSYKEFLNGSTAKSKYISQTVTLANGQDAQDLQIILTAFKPVVSDIKVYVKFLNGEDADIIGQKTWTPMINQSYSLYSDPTNPSDFREFTYKTPSYYGLIPTTGTITCNSSSANVTGTSTLFNTELQVGWYINMRANTSFNEVTRQIISITNSTFMTLDFPFTAPTYTTNSYFIVPPPTTAWLSSNTSTILSGNVTISNTTNIITGSGTNFTGELLSSSIISVNGDQQKILYITNSTSLAVGKPWSSSLSGVNAYNTTPAGVTYLSKNLNLYSTFKKFQVKIVLQSNDTSKVPLLNDIRCLALQL